MGSISKQSVKSTIGVKNLVYNFKRYTFWENQNPKAVGGIIASKLALLSQISTRNGFG